MRDIRNIDLNLLKALDVLLDERSVTRAANKLALTQPAVSGILTRLRDSFDDPLFVRTQRGIIPTPRALELAGPVKRVLEDIGTILQPTSFEPITATKTISIAATDYALQTIIVPFLSALRQCAPNIRIIVRPIEDDGIQSQLENGEVDIALMTPDTTPSELHARRLFDEQYVCVLRQDHPDAGIDKISLDRFCELDHAIVSYVGGSFRGITDLELAKIGRERRVILSIYSFLVLTDILRTTDLIAVVPKRLVANNEHLRLIEPPLVIPGFTKLAVWHERTHHDVAHQWVRSLLLQVCGNELSVIG